MAVKVKLGTARPASGKSVGLGYRLLRGIMLVVLSFVIIGVLLFLPRGLVSLLARRWPVFHERYYRE